MALQRPAPPRSPETAEREERTTVAAPPDMVVGPVAGTVSAEEMDAWPTQAIGPDMDELPGSNQRTRVGTPAYEDKAKQAATPGASVPKRRSSVQAQAAAKANQALRVVVWRGPDGQVRVAPHGTKVSAITVEAMLVALEPGTDLLAWFVPPR
jgi:hypothetical protein